MKPVTFKHSRNNLLGLKGLSFHLPLPMRESHYYVQSKLPSNEFMNIIVDSCPTDKKLVYRYIVDLHKVYVALHWLRDNNHLYAPEKVDFLSAAFEDNLIYSCGIDFTGKETVDLSKTMLKHVDDCEPYLHMTIQPIHVTPKQNRLDIDIYRQMKVNENLLDSKQQHLDHMCYPDLYPCGKGGLYDQWDRIVKPLMFLKNRLGHSDPRFCRCIPYILDENSHHDERSIDQGVYSMLKIAKMKGLMVGDLRTKVLTKDNELEGNLLSMLSNLRGSQGYWYQKFLDLKAMDKKFGPATFFVTLSAAEYYWEDLKKYLQHVNQDIPDVNTWDIMKLCTSDPVSTAIHLKNRIEAVLDCVLLDPDSPPLGAVVHYFTRVEYQLRGAPHFHIKLWIKNAPIIGINSNEEITKFIDKYITCVIPSEIESPVLHELVNKFQIHKCNLSCTKYIKGARFYRRCRFGFPRAVTDVTMLNSIRDSIVSRTRGNKVKKAYDIIRSIDEMYVNDYNPILIYIWRSNMDIQFISDDSLILNGYITTYVTKAESSMHEEIWESLDHSKSIGSKLHSLARRLISK